MNDRTHDRALACIVMAGGKGTRMRSATLKVLHPMFSAQPEIVTRFFNEARAATAIADPGIVQIFDFGYHADGSAYIVMELLEGEPLDKRLARVTRDANTDLSAPLW